MKKTSGLGFAIWINSIFFVLFFLLSGFAIWAVLGQADSPNNIKLVAIALLLFFTLIPSLIFLNNSILFRRISKQERPDCKPIQTGVKDDISKPISKILE